MQRKQAKSKMYWGWVCAYHGIEKRYHEDGVLLIPWNMAHYTGSGSDLEWDLPTYDGGERHMLVIGTVLK